MPVRLGGRYRLLWSAAAVSGLGDGVRYLALPLLAITVTTDPRAISLLEVAGRLPWVVFALVAGVVADRVDRRRAMWTVDLLRCLLMCGLATSVAAGRTGMAALATVAFLLSGAATLFDAASQALVPMIVEPSALDRANSLFATAEGVALKFLGPLVAGVLFGLAHPAPFLLDAATFAVSALLILRLRGTYRAVPDTPEDPGAPGRRRLVEGLRWLRGNGVVRAQVALAGLWNVSDTAVFALLVLYAVRVLGMRPAAVSVLFVVLATGSVAGAVLAPAAARRLGPGWVLRGCLGTFVLSYLGLGLTRAVPVAGAALLVFGFAEGAWFVVDRSTRQALVPNALLGRVTSAYGFVNGLAMPVGAVAGGLAAHAVGLRATFVGAGVLLGLVVIPLLPAIGDRRIAAARLEAAARAA